MALRPRKPTVRGSGFAMRGEVRSVANAIPSIEISGRVQGSVGEGIASVSVDRGTAAGRVFFDAQLGAATSIGANRWEYAFTEVVKLTAGHGGWMARDGGRTDVALSKAFNRLEGINAATGLQGNGVTLPVSGATVLVVPIPVGIVVAMEQRTLADGQTKEYWFAATNGISVECAGGGG